jgi:hypothetical protein
MEQGACSLLRRRRSWATTAHRQALRGLVVVTALASMVLAGCSGPGEDAPSPTAPGPTGTIGPPPVDEPGVDEALERCEARTRTAQIAFEPARQMTVGRAAEVRVQASVAAEPPALPGATSTTLADLTVRCFVQARLRGATFEIDPAGFQTRSFLDQETVSWTWDVVAREEGRHRLTLEVQSLVRDRTGAVDQFSADIAVRAEERSVLQRLDDLVVAVVVHPVTQFLGAATVLAAVGFVARRIRGRPRAPGGTPTQPDVVD